MWDVKNFCLILWVPFHKKELLLKDGYDILLLWETIEQAATLFFGGANPPNERKEGVANDDYIFWFISNWKFIVALIGLCYTIFKGKRK